MWNRIWCMNMFENIKKDGIPHTKEADYDRIPNAPRNKIQIRVMQLMGADASPEAELAWANEFGSTVSEIIDHAKHTVVRNLINEGKYDEAAEEIVSIINMAVIA